MLSVDGDADAAVESRIRVGWTYFIISMALDMTNNFCYFICVSYGPYTFIQEGQHPLTGQHAANVRLLANQ